MTAPIGLPAIPHGVLGRTLGDLVGVVDLSGTDAVEEAINDAIALSTDYGDPVQFGRGIHRLGASIRLVSNATLICHPEAEFVGHFTSSGANGMVMAASGYNETDNPLQNIKIRGGKWRRYGVISGDNDEIWTGYTGNVFSFWGEDVDLSGVWVTGYSGGRGFMMRGHRWDVDRCWIWNPDNTDGQATNVDGGTGGFRWTAGTKFRGTRLKAVCGDDCFQFVPGQTDVDTDDCIYEKCWGISTSARVVVTGLGGDTTTSGSIKRVTFRHIRGEAPSPLNVTVSDSTGVLDVLLEDVKLRQRTPPPHKTGQNTVVAFGFGSTTTGTLRVTMRDCEAINVLNGGLDVSGERVESFIVDGWKQAAPSNTSSTRTPVSIDDADLLVIRNFEVAGRGADGTQHVMNIGIAGAGSRVKRAIIEDGKITNVPAASAAIYGPTNGFEDLTVSRVKVEVYAGVTDATGIRCSNVATRVAVRDCDLSQCAVGSAVTSVPANFEISGTVLPSGTTLLYQQVAAASTVTWDGHSEYIRLTSSGAVSVNTIALPTGYSPHKVPRITIYLANNNDVTFTQADNLRCYGGASVVTNLGDVISFVYDAPTSIWRQVSDHGAN